MLTWAHGFPSQYAWKPLAIRDAVDAFGSVLWLDAGSTVTGRLEPIFEALHRDGHFLVQGQDMDCSRCDGCVSRRGSMHAAAWCSDAHVAPRISPSPLWSASAHVPVVLSSACARHAMSTSSASYGGASVAGSALRMACACC